MVFVYVNACIRIDISIFAESTLKERAMIVTKTELIAVSGSICALCCFLFVMAEHCLFLCVAESINDLFCVICVYDLFRCFVLHLALLLICSCKDLICSLVSLRVASLAWS